MFLNFCKPFKTHSDILIQYLKALERQKLFVFCLQFNKKVSCKNSFFKFTFEVQPACVS